jgi:hypothetical protein
MGTCKVPGCGGQISENPTVILQTGCRSSAPVHSCIKCGRLHWSAGNLVFNRQNHAAFLEGDNVVNRDEAGHEMSRL